MGTRWVPTSGCLGRLEQATQEFAREVYYASLQFGVEDARTAAGNHNLATAFKARGMPAEALRCCGHVSPPHLIHWKAWIHARMHELI